MTDQPEYSIRGVGRVGQRSRLRSRPRRCWQVVRFNRNPEHPDTHLSPLIGYEPVEGLPDYKTATLAAHAAKTIAKETNGVITAYADGFLRKRPCQ